MYVHVVINVTAITEAAPAAEAGLKVCLVVREGNTALTEEEKAKYSTISSFSDLFAAADDEEPPAKKAAPEAEGTEESNGAAEDDDDGEELDEVDEEEDLGEEEEEGEEAS